MIEQNWIKKAATLNQRKKKRSYNLSFVIGCLMIALFIILAAAAPLIAPVPQGGSPYAIPKDGFSMTPNPPSETHPLGTLSGQYDIFYGLIWGSRMAFKIGVLVALGRALVGVLLGLLAGYWNGIPSSIILRFTDVFMAIPLVAAAMLILVLLPEAPSVILALILFGWMQYTRLVSGNILVERSKEYVNAAISIGVSKQRLLWWHLLPNATRGIFVLMASDVSAAVIWAAVFYFIGLTGLPGSDLQADWGQMLVSARDWIIVGLSKYWYTYLPPSICLVLFSMSWNFISDGLSNALDPLQN